MIKPTSKNLQWEEEDVSGWGKMNYAKIKSQSPKSNNEVSTIIKNSNSLISRGLGRSYGDAAQLDGSQVLRFSNFDKCEISFEKTEMTVGAGLSIKNLISKLVPLGLFLPVTPGSCNVTIGGAIAADVHGKNHVRDGSFGRYVKRILIINSKGCIEELYPENQINQENTEKFWATVGGMGLTGIIVEATVSLIEIETSLIKTNTLIFEDINELMDFMKANSMDSKYSVAWIDTLNSKGRGVLTLGDHAMRGESKNFNQKDLLFFSKKSLISAPNIFPNGLLNKFSVKAFNKIWFAKSKLERGFNYQSIFKYFYPLDSPCRVLTRAVNLMCKIQFFRC